MGSISSKPAKGKQAALNAGPAKAWPDTSKFPTLYLEWTTAHGTTVQEVRSLGDAKEIEEVLWRNPATVATRIMGAVCISHRQPDTTLPPVPTPAGIVPPAGWRP